MLIVTGAAGFIGSNVVAALNERGTDDILAVDNLENGRKVANLGDLKIADYMDKDDFFERLEDGHTFPSVEAVIHEGACTSTVEWDGRYMMHNNFEYSKVLLHYCRRHASPLQYASSAGVYGNSGVFAEDEANERPMTIYAYSKWLFDRTVRRVLAGDGSPVAGFRYFNVYGPREGHKDFMCSAPWHFNRQLREDGRVRVFGANETCAAGEHRRDFTHVDDVVRVKLWWLDAENRPSGVFNLGSGAARTFREVADAVVAWHGAGEVEYIPFPDELKSVYQDFTEADLTRLRAAGYDGEFTSLEQGIGRYLEWLAQHRQGVHRA